MIDLKEQKKDPFAYRDLENCHLSRNIIPLPPLRFRVHLHVTKIRVGILIKLAQVFAVNSPGLALLSFWQLTVVL